MFVFSMFALLVVVDVFYYLPVESGGRGFLSLLVSFSFVSFCSQQTPELSLIT